MIESYNVNKLKEIIKQFDDTLWKTDLENKSTFKLYREHKIKIKEEQQSYDNTAATTIHYLKQELEH